MEKMKFWKMSGSGNDFILVDNRDGTIAEEEMSSIAERACRRRESVGADGMIFIIGSDRYDFAWRFFNADGGEAEMCGNGGRCAARFAYLNGISGTSMTFGTLAGPVSAEVFDRVVKVLMPVPFGLKTDIDIPLEPDWININFINTGVPHVVVQVEGLKDLPVFEQGRALRYHPMFAPEGTNANFMSVRGRDYLYVRTYERGVENETMACGTGAIASSLIASIKGMVSSPVKVLTSGGEELTIHFVRENNHFKKVWLEGNTSVVYKADMYEEAL